MSGIWQFFEHIRPFTLARSPFEMFEQSKAAVICQLEITDRSAAIENAIHCHLDVSKLDLIGNLPTDEMTAGNPSARVSGFHDAVLLRELKDGM